MNKRIGRPGGIRTPSIRFWRPALYQLELLACTSLDAHQNNGSVPICRIRSGQFGGPSKASRTDHYYGFALSRSRFAPVCAAPVASRYFFDGAASLEASRYRARAPRPPLRGGEYDAFKFRPNGNVIAIGCGVAALCLFVANFPFLRQGYP